MLPFARCVQRTKPTNAPATRLVNQFTFAARQKNRDAQFASENGQKAQAEQVASVHVFISQEGAETIPRGGIVFLWGSNRRVGQRRRGVPARCNPLPHKKEPP